MCWMPLPLPFRSRPRWPLVIISILLILPLAIVGCGPTAASSASGTLATQTPHAGPTASSSQVRETPPLVVPSGWTQVLPNLILSDNSHFNTLVTSAAKPERIAACAMPDHPWPVMVAPLLVVSDDGGRTWQQRAIPLAGQVWECDLRGDILNPDTYAVSLIDVQDGKANTPDETLVTRDAGRTWQIESMPTSMEYSCATLPQQLSMPSWVSASPCVVDPWDPAHLYAVIPIVPVTTSHGLSLYETRNSGSTWRQLRVWPTALGPMEIYPTSDGLYAVDEQDASEPGVYRSADGGVTWKKLPLKGAVSWISYFGLDGRLLTTTNPQLFQVDPVTGQPTLLGEVPFAKEGNGSVSGIISAVAICEGSQPSLVVAGPYGTYVRALPPLRG